MVFFAETAQPSLRSRPAPPTPDLPPLSFFTIITAFQPPPVNPHYSPCLESQNTAPRQTFAATCRHASMQLYFNSSAAGQSVGHWLIVGQSVGWFPSKRNMMKLMMH
jgi:hypothetical protein